MPPARVPGSFAGSNQAKLCGYDNGPFDGTCFCGTLYYGKIRPTWAPVGGCIQNEFCADGIPCSRQRDCPAGTVCTTASCCETFGGYGPVCVPYRQQGSIGRAKPLATPKTAAHK